MKTFKKVLYQKTYESPVAWSSSSDDQKAQNFFELKVVFDFKEGLRFTASAADVSFCRRNPFAAIFRLLEHESIGMSKYKMLKYHTRRKGVYHRL